MNHSRMMYSRGRSIARIEKIGQDLAGKGIVSVVFIYSFVSCYPHVLLQSNFIDQQTIEKAFLGTVQVTSMLRKVPGFLGCSVVYAPDSWF